MINKTLYNIFQQGSRTYFYSSLFFPTKQKKDVFTLYGFVRKTDNYVDHIPQKINAFYEFKNKYQQAIDGKKTDDIVIKHFIELINKKQFQKEWIDSFLDSMEMDITKKTYKNLQETLQYIHGSAEVIGLMMAKILNLKPDAYHYAKYLGRAMQYINFIRDINEDNKLGRIYFPQADLQKHKLKNLEYEHTKKHPEQFKNFIHQQLERYCEWQETAEKGYKYIPKRYLIPVKTASEMYHWTAEQIYKNPFIIYQTKVKPKIIHILKTTSLNIIDPHKHKHNINTCLLPKTYKQPIPLKDKY
jgi:phytoene synthase